MSSAVTVAVLLAACQAAPATTPGAPPPADAGQVSGADTDAPTAAGQTGALTFPPSFFAEARPNTASDMVARVPGF